MAQAILVINSGSSSIKFAVYSTGGGEGPLVRGKIAGIGNGPDFVAVDGAGSVLDDGALADIAADAGHGGLVVALLDWLERREEKFEIVAAGHRVVHGGTVFDGPVRVAPETMAQMRALTPLAPLHQPHNLAAIEALAARSRNMAQVACFDTSFHRSQPRLAQLFGLPRALADEGIVRYGFHGLSYDYIAGVLGEIDGCSARGRVLVAHLGNGASVCALSDGKSVATSMGFTALDGLLMGRRCGAIDAGAVLHLVQQKGMSVPEVHEMLYRQSGLLGVSGISNNMRDLSESDDPRAKEAIELFCYRAAREFASHIAALEGVDSIVFTAGIGENSALVRRKICERLAWLGVRLDEAANAKHAQKISASNSTVSLHVVATNEELVIARAVRRLVSG